MEEEEEASIQIISISDLLLASSPLSGTSSLHSIPPRKKLKTVQNPNPSHNFNHPVLLIGTVNLPSPDDSDENHCFSFSDGRSRVCCSLLDLKDLSFIGKEIRVLAWNFIPFNDQEGGILEIIRWILPSSSQLTPKVDSFLLKSHNLTFVGVLKSASPIFSILRKNPGSNGGSIGFLAKLVNYDISNPHLELDNSKFVYFVKPANKWRPVMNKLAGQLIEISGLRKKMIFVGEGMSFEMFVTTETTAVSLHKLPLGVMLNWKDEGVYIGVVTRVYMQGMAIELDEKVWLLVTDPRIAPVHSIRVGAIISVRNAHHLRPKFSWIDMHLLGTCARSNIDVKLFSLPDARSYVCPKSQSMLLRFIESLTLSTKFWVLLLACCLRRKFAKVFSNREILGSKKKKGLAQVYASGYLDSHSFRLQHGIFEEFCKHGECSCEDESAIPSLKLVVPISNLISKCEALWVSILSQAHCHAETVKPDGCCNHFTGGTSGCCTIRRIISSDDLGFILMGTLKISLSGRLQLVDATGGVDVVVPDLHSNINDQNIYEVKNYKLIMEDSSMQLDLVGFPSVEALSCRNIFENFPSNKVLRQLVVYILFYLKDSTCLNVLLRPPSCMLGNDVFHINTDEKAHLLFVTHKFPLTKNFQGNPIHGGSVISCDSPFNAEAIVLPYKLILQKDNDYNLLVDPLPRKLQVESINVKCDGCFERPASFEMDCRSIVGLKNDAEEDKRSFSNIPCMLTFRSTDLQGSPVPGYLCTTESSVLQNVNGKQREQRVLLEFKFDSFFNYQMLQHGRYYVLKCSNSQYDIAVGNKTNHCKILVTPQMTLWSLSFNFGGIMRRTNLSQDHSSGGSSLRTSEDQAGDTPQNNVLLQLPLSQMCRNSDVQIHLFSEVKDVLFRTFPDFEEVFSVSSCLQIMNAKVGTTLSTDTQFRDMPQGNLISICGNIDSIQTYNCNTGHYARSPPLFCADIDQGMSCNIVIHVYDDHHKVQIHGSMSKHSYPLGMGPGANATFHRVRMACPSMGCPRLVLTPVSFVVVNSIKEAGHEHCDKKSAPQSKFNVLVEESSAIISLGLISKLTKCLESNLIRINCRVVTIYILVLEFPTHASSKSRLKQQLKYTACNVTLAGFMLDDGSSVSCFWTSGERADRLLMLHETMRSPFFHDRRSSKNAEVESWRETAGYHLEKMLKKHRRVIVINNRVVPDSSTYGFTFVANPGKFFSRSDEKLLRRIMLNACTGPAFNIVGTVMDPNALQSLDAELMGLHVVMPPTPNVWITDVGCLNPLNEARNLLDMLRS